MQIYGLHNASIQVHFLCSYGKKQFAALLISRGYYYPVSSLPVTLSFMMLTLSRTSLREKLFWSETIHGVPVMSKFIWHYPGYIY